jgi:sucrose-phosphate synthase
MIALITDIDGTISGDAEGINEFKDFIFKLRENVFFVYATGRCMEDYKEIKDRDNLPLPDALILNTGADVYFNNDGIFEHNETWNEKINLPNWNNRKILNLLKEVKEITPQKNIQRFKVSFYAESGKERIAKEKTMEILKRNEIKANVIISHGIYLDVLPANCDKGKAALFLIREKKIKKNDVIVAGDSENDIDLFYVFEKGIVVANALNELKDKLKNKKIYFAKNSYAKGVIEGINFYLQEWK